MNAQEYADLLNGRQYGEEISKAEEDAAKNDGIVIAFGYSDDLIEFRGAICDEVGLAENVSVTSNGIRKTWDEVDKEDKEEMRRFFNDEKLPCVTLKVSWPPFEITCDAKDAASFSIHEGDDLFCKGVVFKNPKAKGGNQ
jgi:hypothetical protein